MDVHVSAPRLPARQLVEVALVAESRGFTGLWLPDHILNPVEFSSEYPYTFDGRRRYGPDAPLADPLVTLSHIAALTRRIELGVGVYILALRPVPLAVSALATLSNLAGSRLNLGVGVGWLAEEFDALGIEFADRGPQTDEAIRQVLDILESGQIRLASGAYALFPYEHREAPPIFVGGVAPPAIRRCAEFGAGWYGPRLDLERSITAKREISSALALAGRDPLEFKFLPRIDGLPDAANLQRYEEAGFTECVVPLSREVGLTEGWETAVDLIAAG